MAAVSGQDSNLSSVSYAVESSPKTLPVTPTWILTEPNAEPEFGPNVTDQERTPISSDRLSKKGSIVDLEASVQLEVDFIPGTQREILQPFMFAALRGKGEHEAITGVTAADDTFAAASGLGIFAANDLVFASGFSNAANNGLHLVSSSSATTLVVTTALVDETPPSGAKIVKVGHQYATADVTVNAGGARPLLVTAADDFGDLDLVPGESIYIGGDAAGTQFASAANNGAKRVFAVAGDGSTITLDKSQLDMVTDASATGKTIRIFTGYALKNEQIANILRRTLQFERTLGAPDDASPSQIQSEYVTGCHGAEYSYTAEPASKVTASLTFMGLDHETRTGATGVKSGNRPALADKDATNTASDVRRSRISALTNTDEAPDPLFALIERLDFSINNHLERNLALGTLGAARITVGRFELTGSFEAYFANVSALDVLRNFTDVTIDQFVATAGNEGYAWDMPLCSLSSGRVAIEPDTAMKMPCDFKAHSGAKFDSTFDHALCWTFFPYLPSLARTVP